MSPVLRTATGLQCRTILQLECIHGNYNPECCVVSQCSAVQYSAVQYSAVQCSIVQCSAVQYTATMSEFKRDGANLFDSRGSSCKKELLWLVSGT